MSAHAYRARDYSFFARMASGFVASGLGAGYLGTYEDNVVIEPPPAPTGVRSAPTLWGRWGYQYDRDPLMTLDLDGPVCRFGVLVLAARIEPGGDVGLVRGTGGLFDQWSDLCSSRNDQAAGVTIYTESHDDNHGLQAGWMLYALPLRFALTD